MLNHQASRVTPWKTVGTVMLAIMTAEMGIMLVIDNPFVSGRLDLHKLELGLTDAFSLGLIISPIVYFFLLIPLRRKTVLEQEQIRSLQDDLTGLPTRVLFEELVQHGITLARRQNHPLTLIALDPARLSEINQVFGYAFGDEILTEIGKRLAALLRESDVVARISGDEFGILLPSLGEEHIDAVIRKVVKSFNEPFLVQDISVNIGVTMGVVIFPDHIEDASTAIQRARIALSKAKSDLASYAIFDAAYESNTQDRIKLYREIRRAINDGEFELYYQPKLHLGSQKSIGAEALIRWPTVPAKFINMFIPFAEQVGLIDEITKWVSSRAIEQVGQWQSEGLTVPISINISVRDLLNNALSERLATLCRSNKVPPSLITIEVTESAMMLYPEKAIRILRDLDSHGFHIAIDDFGTGHASFLYLRDIPASELKIDQSFVSSLGSGDKTDVLFRSMVELGRNLGMQTVAEGIETEDILKRVQALGCAIGQGFYFSPAMPPHKFVQWIGKHSESRDDTHSGSET